MVNKIREKINIFIAKSPRQAMLIGIMLFNVVFILVAATIINLMSKHLSGLAPKGFWQSVYYTATLVLDPGCISGMILDVGKTGVLAVIVCVAVVVLGLVFFTGSVIGYVTNTISDFIESKNNGRNRLLISDHVVIINWNARGTEIINEFLYRKKEIKVVVFVPDRKDEIDAEIRNRLNTTLIREAQQVYAKSEGMSFIERRRYLRENMPKERITYIVREGDVAAATDLDDICISKAGTVIILDNACGPEVEKGNPQTVKTLIQVSEISKANSRQMILVEVADEWTEDLVYRIIAFKSVEIMETIIPVSYNKLVGSTYSQIAVVPELNDVYDVLFSLKGIHFISRNVPEGYSRENEDAYIEKCLNGNICSVPMTVMETLKGNKIFYIADSKSDIELSDVHVPVEMEIQLKKSNRIRRRSIVVLGHNSYMNSLMEGFDSIRHELELMGEPNAITVIMVDDAESLESHDCYRSFPYVSTIAADIYDEDYINRRMDELSRKEAEDTTILILSDDTAASEDVDANALTFLIYIQEQIRRRQAEDPDFDRSRLALIVEVLNPKNEDIVRSYGADRVIVSSRYLSRMIAQFSLGEAVLELYEDMLSSCISNGESLSKELYIKSAEDFFEKLPGKCTAYELIRAVLASGDEGSKSVLIGYIRGGREYIFFNGDQRKIDIELRHDDLLILFGNQYI